MRYLLFFILLILLESCAKKPNSVQKLREEYSKTLNEHPSYLLATNSYQDSLKSRPDLAWHQNFIMTMDPLTGKPESDRLIPVYEKLRSVNNNISLTTPLLPTTSSGINNWESRGPLKVGGRSRALLFDPNDATSKKVWCGSVSGGLWYNNDITSASSSWEIASLDVNLSISSIVADPLNSNRFYVGTGEGWPWDGTTFSTGATRGFGVFTSIDAGATWNQLSSSVNLHYINKLFIRIEVLAGQNTSVLYAASHKLNFENSYHGENGLFRSTDNGSTWSKVFSKGTADIEEGIDGRMYISTFDGEIHISDNGIDWAKKYPRVPFDPSNGSRIELATAPSNANIVYAIITSNNSIQSVRVSNNRGDTFTPLISLPNDVDTGISDDDFTRGQAWYNLALAIKPDDDQTIYIGGIDNFVSTNGGSDWSQIGHWYGGYSLPYIHADQHNFIFRPGYPNEGIALNDGGVFYITNLSTSPVINPRNLNYNVTQFYSCAIHPDSGSNYFLA